MIEKEILKNYLIDNDEETLKILEFFGFHDFHKNGDRIRCALPDRDNPTSVAVDLSTLYCNIFVTPTYDDDIFGMLLHWNSNFGNSYKWDFGKLLRIIDESILHITKSEKIRKIEDYRKKPYQHKVLTDKADDVHEKESVEYNLDYLNRFVRLPHINFINEGILPFVQKKYSICYDDKEKRILIPHFKFDDKTKIVGLQGRTTIELHDLFDIPKYKNYIVGYRKSMNLYALSHNIDDIRKEKQIVVFESEKSVMKLESFKLFPNITVALGGSSLSDWQANYIGQLSNDIKDFEVVIALDKDISEDIVKNMACKLKENGCGEVSYIIDEQGLLKEKDSPVDMGIHTWFKLFGSRKRLD